jgi:hypothetical protein
MCSAVRMGALVDRPHDRKMGDDRIACVSVEFSMFRNHINSVDDRIACVDRQLSMFRSDRRIVSRAFSIFRTHRRTVTDRIASVSPAFRIFKDERILVDDRMSIVPPQSNVDPGEIAIGERRNRGTIDRCMDSIPLNPPW